MDVNNMLDTCAAIVNKTADVELLNANANKASERLPVQRDMIAGEVCKAFALGGDYYSKEVVEAHQSGDLHLHDLDYSPFQGSFNCMLIDIKGMMSGGFKMGNADIETPKSIGTATALCAQIIAQVASHIYGGNTINRIDEVLAPYVKASYEKHLAKGKLWCKDAERAVAYATHMTEKETYDAFQALEYEVNTMHTANGQTPFTTLGFGLGTCWEARLIQKAILNVRLAGLGRFKRTAVFPKLVFAIKDGVNHKKGDVNYDIKRLALQCASERIYPDILNYERLVEVTGGFKTPMGCRSFLHEHPDGADGRNNLGVVSINLPRIAIESKVVGYNNFWWILEDKLELCYQALTTRIDALRGITADVAPILYMEGACGKRLKADDEIMQLFDKGRASISLGYIGLHEMAMAMFPDGVHTFDSEEKRKFCHDVVKFLSDKTKQWKAESGFAFSLYSTPSESLCDRFCRLDVGKFGEQEGITDKGYYTNSFHLDVAKKVAPNSKIDFEKGFPALASGGFICYYEAPDMKRFLDALEWVWDYSFDHIPYFGVNTPIDYCEACSFAGETEATENGFTCPQCGNHDSSTLQVVRRVCGYLGAPNARPFIEGKQREMIGRVKHGGG
jgi:anaerobic ribonucleoside-triphosphate reductase